MKDLTVEQCVAALKMLRRDAEMALNGEWDKIDEGFIAQIDMIDELLKGTSYEE